MVRFTRLGGKQPTSEPKLNQGGGRSELRNNRMMIPNPSPTTKREYGRKRAKDSAQTMGPHIARVVIAPSAFGYAERLFGSECADLRRSSEALHHAGMITCRLRQRFGTSLDRVLKGLDSTLGPGYHHLTQFLTHLCALCFMSFVYFFLDCQTYLQYIKWTILIQNLHSG